MLSKHNLDKILQGNIVIVGVGNIDNGDDGAGSMLVQEINGRVSATCIDAGVAPENFLERIVHERPDTVLIVDAADFEGEPGEARLFDPGQIGPGGLSTHALSLDMVCRYLKERTFAGIYLLAIQPGQVKSQQLSHAVEETLESLTKMLLPRKEDT